MDIKSTLVKNRSTDGKNHSSAGSNERIAHTTSPIRHPVAPRGNPGKIAISPELPYDNNNVGDSVDAGKKFNGVRAGSFTPHNARNTASGVFPKHPFKSSDPAACKC